MTTDPYAHHWSNWMKQRLNEMDATSTSIEIRLATLKADAKKQAEKAVADIQAQRAAFQEAIRKQQHESEAAWAKTKTALEANWASFETAVQDYLKHARPLVEQQQATFKARAEAQRKAWEETDQQIARQGRHLCRSEKAGAGRRALPFAGRGRRCKMQAGNEPQGWGAILGSLENGPRGEPGRVRQGKP